MKAEGAPINANKISLLKEEYWDQNLMRDCRTKDEIIILLGLFQIKNNKNQKFYKK